MVSSRTGSAYELRAAKFVILSFCRCKKDLAVHVEMNNQVALAYLVKMGGTRNLLMIQEAKEIWEFCLTNQITLTAEYLLGQAGQTRFPGQARFPGK